MKIQTNLAKRTIASGLFSALLLLSGFCVPCSVLAQQNNQWAVEMFNEMKTDRVHDFGSVALHANVEHRFAFKNIYKEDVEILSASSNCGCTKVAVNKKIVRSMETAEIIARVDTSGKEHTKKRKATITVQFSKPRFAEVQLQVRTYIRADVGFDRGSVEFGTVPLGHSVTKKIFLQYEGRDDWALTGIKRTNPAIRAEAKEVQRQNGRVLYEVLVTLKPDASPGYLNDLLRFTTNDLNAATASVFLPINGLVMEPLTVKPSYMQIGVVYAGEAVSKNLVVRSSTPFQIKKITSSDSRVTFMVANQESKVHVVPITFSADQKVGYFNQTITIVTNLKDQSELVVPFNFYILDSQNAAAPLSQDQTTDAPALKLDDSTNDDPRFISANAKSESQLSETTASQNEVVSSPDDVSEPTNSLTPNQTIPRNNPVPTRQTSPQRFQPRPLQNIKNAIQNNWSPVSIAPLENKTRSVPVPSLDSNDVDSSRKTLARNDVESSANVPQNRPVFRSPQISLNQETVKRF